MLISWCTQKANAPILSAGTAAAKWANASDRLADELNNGQVTLRFGPHPNPLPPGEGIGLRSANPDT